MLQWFLYGHRWYIFYVALLSLTIILTVISSYLGYQLLFLNFYLVIFVLIFIINFLPTLLFSVVGAFSKIQKANVVIHTPINFLVIIPAYNEKQVILNSVESLIKQKIGAGYNARIVVAFNGTDETGKIAEEAGAEVFTTPIPQCGKSKAIEYVLSSVPMMQKGYVIIIDADNIVADDYLLQVAQACQSQLVAYQSNHQPLLISNNWISKGLNAGYCASSRLFNIGRSRLLNSALLCGTGMVIREDVIRTLWSKIKTQTEDIELNGLLNLYYQSGVQWIDTAFFYDEKPDVLDVAIRQRVRWMVGHFRCAYFYSGKLLKRFLFSGDIRSLELAIYYWIPLSILASAIWLFLLLPISLVGYAYDLHIYQDVILNVTLIILAYMILLPALGYYLQNTQVPWIIRLPQALLYSLYAMLFATYVWPISIIFACFSLSSTTWIFHTPHKAKSANL